MKYIKDTPRLYPKPCGLQKIYLTLKEIWRKADALKLNNDAKRKKRTGGQEHTTYFCIGLSKIWQEKIYNII